MRSTTSLFLLLQLVPACADVSDDPNRQPPGQPGTDDGSSSSGDDAASDTAMGDDSVGDDGNDVDTSSDGAGESDDGSTEEMPCGDLCLAKAPSGWHGPAAFVRSSAADEPPDCGDTHPVELATLVSDLIPQAAICDCNCGEAVGAVCDSAVARVYDNAGCSDLIDTFDIGLSCTNGVDPIEGYWNIAFDPPTGGECEPLPSFEIPALDYTRWTMCGAAESPGECAPDEVCTATPGDGFEAAQCIWQEGDMACPDRFSERTLVYTEIADDRSCGECSCAAPTGTCAGGEVLLDYTPSCPGGTIASWYAVPGECLELSFESGQITQEAMPFASCEPTMPLSLGSATLEQPVTLCCEAR